ncbi:hypothetical protein [Micromonospora sp. RTGN7]|uniref:hypothetical protein n=1 Tax=Micromonospora sp. RTGN7 TaxID=3016526 RepID=UPI0029FF1A06|nr:hypothetical protein [Micromonospora sp. RTGN7]
MRLLVHIAGEADLLLSSQNGSSIDLRVERIRERCRQLNAATADPEGLIGMLREGVWADQYLGTQPPSPLLKALTAVSPGPDLDVLLIGTERNPSHPLDTMLTARALANALKARLGKDGETIVRTAEPIIVEGQNEKNVVPELVCHLAGAPNYQEAYVTWGAGATALAMCALTALSEARIPWRLALTPPSGEGQVIDPLEQLETDPVIGVLVRWRMFGTLAELAGTNPPLVRLTARGLELVNRAVERHNKGFQAHDAESLRVLLADAVVRRDGTASLAVRRYITRKYDELFSEDKEAHSHINRLVDGERGGEVGRQLRQIERGPDDPAVLASLGLPSGQWLRTREVGSLLSIGNGSHNLLPPALDDSKIIGSYLSRYDVDGKGWQEAGLPEPPIAPADMVLTVWLAGNKQEVGGRDGRPIETVGQQLSNRLPAGVVTFLGVEEVRLRAVIFGVDGDGGSAPMAEAEAEIIRAGRYGSTPDSGAEAWAELIGITDIDQLAVERAIESRLTRETGALLLVPTGRKQVMLSLLRAMRLIGARHGIPLFVRENAEPEESGEAHKVHLWPALTGGDLPLLIAAAQAMRTLELDVAWRLLDASAIGEEITRDARRLADSFASRKPLCDEDKPQTVETRRGWTKGRVVQRLELVEAALASTTAPAQCIRMLVLAADCVEASFAAAAAAVGKNPRIAYSNFFQSVLEEKWQRGGPREAWSALIFFVLRKARNGAPVAHGGRMVADEVVAEAAKSMVEHRSVPAAEAALLPQDAATLLREAISAAAQQDGLGQPDEPDSLRQLHSKLLEQIQAVIDTRRVVGRPVATRE